MSEPQQPFGDAEPRPSLAEQAECIVELIFMTRAAFPERAHVLRAVLDTLRKVEAGEAGEL